MQMRCCECGRVYPTSELEKCKESWGGGFKAPRYRYYCVPCGGQPDK